MPFPAWAAGMRITAQRLLDMAPLHMSATLRRSTAQTIPNAANTEVLWNFEEEDSHGGHSLVTNTGRLYLPYNGRYELTTSLAWADNATGRRSGAFGLNDATPKYNGGSEHINAATNTVLNITRTLRAAAGDYVNVWVFQTSGGNLDLVTTINDGCVFTVDYLGP